jgi:hypothetical protein
VDGALAGEPAPDPVVVGRIVELVVVGPCKRERVVPAEGVLDGTGRDDII